MSAVAEEKITYDDQVTPIFRINCFKCHNPDKSKGDLDLTTYSAVLKGGGSGKAVLPGDAAGSKLYKSIARVEEPFMPNNSPKLPDADIEVIQKWIAGGLLEKSSSQAMAANKPRIGLLSNSAAQGKKPDGPVVLPIEWRLEPVVRTERTTAVTALSASPWSPLVAVGGQHELLVYHTGTFELLGVLPFPEVNPVCVQFSRDSRLLVVGGGRGAKFGFVDVYEIATGERVTRVGNEFDTVLAADLNSDQTKVALGGPGKHVKVFSTRNAKLLQDLKKHTDWVTAIQYSPDSVLLATGDRNGGLVVWEADSGQELYTLTGHTAAISALSWRDDSDVLLSASEDGSIRVWEMREGRQVANWTAHKDGVLDARFGHDTRIVSCGRDKRIALWDASGNQQRNWDAGDLPVRATFSHDGTQVLASSWQGKIGIWLAANGKSAGEITSNPPTLNERLASATQIVASREADAAKAAEGLAAAEAETKKIDAARAAHDQTSTSFQFVAASRQALAAHRKAAEEANKGLEKLKAVAAKSAAELAAAEAEAAKIQTALGKVEKFPEPYKQLTRRLETATQEVATATAKAAETAKALADKTTAINAAAADLSTRITAAAQARDKANAALDELNKRSEVAVRAVAQARTVADQDKAKLAQQQAGVTQAMTLIASAESETARITQLLASKKPSQEQELSKQLEVATRQVADARVAHENSQKALGDLKTVAEKSTALVVTNEVEVVKLKASIETAQKALQTAKDTVGKLETAKMAAAEAAKQETETLQTSVAQAASALAAAKAKNADLRAKLDKTEKFSDAFKELRQRLETANKQVAALLVAADHDRKEVADLETALAKIKASADAADAEAAKATETMARNDPSYQHYQELEKQLATANQKVSDAKGVSARTRKEVDAAKGVVDQIRVAQARMALSEAREALAAGQQSQQKLLAAVTAAQEENDKATKDLTELTRQVKTLTESMKSSAAKLQTAKAAAAEADRQLAAVKERTDKLAADYQRLKSVSSGDRAQAKP